MTTRRHFIRLLPVAGATLAAASAVQSADLPMVSEKDPAAAGLGYVADATKVDKAKFTKYAAGQQCGNCVLYQGKAGDAGGPCPLFAGKQVSAKGWCSAYAKKG